MSEVEIKGATIKDDYCNYSYELTDGATAGDKVSRKGAAVIHEDMKLAFQVLNPHLAAICEEIEVYPALDLRKIQKYDSLIHKEGSLEHKVSHFSVTGFKVLGSGDNEAVSLVGEKRLSTGDSVGLTTPNIKWEDSTYLFIPELKAAVNNCILEVEEYMNGKAAPKAEQASIQFPGEGEEEEEPVTAEQE